MKTIPWLTSAVTPITQVNLFSLIPEDIHKWMAKNFLHLNLNVLTDSSNTQITSKIDSCSHPITPHCIKATAL